MSEWYEQTDELVAQYSHLYSWLFWATVNGAKPEREREREREISRNFCMRSDISQKRKKISTLVSI